MPSYWQRVVARVGGRRLLLAIGVTLVGLGIALSGVELLRDTPVSTTLLLAAFVVVPGLSLLYGGRRLGRADVDPRSYPGLLARCLAGFGAMVGVVVLYDLLAAGTVGHPLRAVLVLGAFGSVAGYRVGLHDARAAELERTKRALDDTVEQLETSNELLEQFAYAASHDLQEPLRMVSSHLLLLERRCGDDLDESSREYLAFAVDRADRMREMIDGLLEYARIETTAGPLAPVALDPIVEEVLEDLQLRIEEADAEIDIEPLPRVRGDGRQLAQVFQNLVTNAIEYSGEGPPRIAISAARDGPAWTVSVADEGIGIEPDEVDRVFTVFERLDPADQLGGTGIGLTLCKRIVERHGGDIQVDSTPGEGSTFAVSLPAAGAPADG